eukprot:tig00000849_g4770.t1
MASTPPPLRGAPAKPGQVAAVYHPAMMDGLAVNARTSRRMLWSPALRWLVKNTKAGGIPVLMNADDDPEFEERKKGAWPTVRRLAKSLRAQSLLVLLLLIATLFVVMGVIIYQILPASFGELEAADAKHSLARLSWSLVEALESMGAMGLQFASWDEACELMFPGTPQAKIDEFVKYNYAEDILPSLDLAFVGHYDVNGAYRYGSALGGEGMPEGFRALPAGHPMRAAANRTSGVGGGIFLLPFGAGTDLFLVTSAPLQFSNYSGDINGAHVGVLVWGRRFSPAIKQKLARQSQTCFAEELFGAAAAPHADPDLAALQRRAASEPAPPLGTGFPGATSSYPPVESRAIEVPPGPRPGAANGTTPRYCWTAGARFASYAVLGDAFGRPAMAVRVDIPRDIVAKGAWTLTTVFWSFAGVCFMIAVITIVYIEAVIVRPISMLTRSVRGVVASGTPAPGAGPGGGEAGGSVHATLRRADFRSDLHLVPESRRVSELELEGAGKRDGSLAASLASDRGPGARRRRHRAGQRAGGGPGGARRLGHRPGAAPLPDGRGRRGASAAMSPTGTARRGLALPRRATVGRVGPALEFQFLSSAINRMLNWILDQKDASERILYDTIPEAIVARLKAGEASIADAVPDATVLFADICGFTQMAANLEPMSLVSLLSLVFTRLDDVIAGRGVEKIKNIGDAVLAVAGLREQLAADEAADAASSRASQRNEAREAVELALDMLDEVERINAQHRLRLQLRIGVCSGPLVAGVIGRKKLVFDIWGDTVNVASRMEQAAEPGTIALAESTVLALGRSGSLSARSALGLGLGLAPPAPAPAPAAGDDAPYPLEARLLHPRPRPRAPASPPSRGFAASAAPSASRSPSAAAAAAAAAAASISPLGGGGVLVEVPVSPFFSPAIPPFQPSAFPRPRHGLEGPSSPAPASPAPGPPGTLPDPS